MEDTLTRNPKSEQAHHVFAYLGHSFIVRAELLRAFCPDLLFMLLEPIHFSLNMTILTVLMEEKIMFNIYFAPFVQRLMFSRLWCSTFQNDLALDQIESTDVASGET